MTTRKQCLELTWVGKDQRPRLEPRILIEDPEKSYHAPHRVTDHDLFDNRLIFSDNLLALKALEQEFAGKIKCVFIDPPYNTGSAFTHYDDGLEHSLWLTMIRDRLEIIRRLIAVDGVLFVSIDDAEQPYLRVLLDELFGRKNFCGQFVWEKKKKPSFLNASMGIVTEYVVAYAVDRVRAPAFIGGTTTAGKKYPLNNAGNGLATLTFPPRSVRFGIPDGVVEPCDMSEGAIITRLLDTVTIDEATNTEAFRLEGEWRYSQRRVDEIISQGEQLVISRKPFRPNHVKTGGEPKKLKNLLSVSHYGMSTYEDATDESRALFGADAFDYPKPEQLIQLLLDAVTSEGDIVLDSFAGSGTTGAVAHKMGRRWIMVELGEHCHTHIIPRLHKVIDGDDPGGITDAVKWKGGGGFRYYRLAPSLMEQDRWGNWIVSKEYNAAMLAEAVAKLEGFRYAPSEDCWWQHGKSTEQDFIYVTTQTLTAAQLDHLSEEVGAERTLLVCCGAWKGKGDRWPNLTLKKIPQAVLSKCEWGRDDYSLEIRTLPDAPRQEPDQADIFDGADE